MIIIMPCYVKDKIKVYGYDVYHRFRTLSDVADVETDMPPVLPELKNCLNSIVNEGRPAVVKLKKFPSFNIKFA